MKAVFFAPGVGTKRTRLFLISVVFKTKPKQKNKSLKTVDVNTRHVRVNLFNLMVHGVLLIKGRGGWEHKQLCYSFFWSQPSLASSKPFPPSNKRGKKEDDLDVRHEKTEVSKHETVRPVSKPRSPMDNPAKHN